MRFKLIQSSITTENKFFDCFESGKKFDGNQTVLPTQIFGQSVTLKKICEVDFIGEVRGQSVTLKRIEMSELLVKLRRTQDDLV